MDENNTNALAEATAPQGTEEQSATEVDTSTAEQDTIPAQADSGEAEQNSDIEQGEETGGENSAIDSSPFLTVRYNHENKELTHAETVTLAQKAMQAEPLMSDLRYLAAQDGASSVAAYVKGLMERADETRRTSIQERLADSGDTDLLETILKAETDKLRSKAGALEQEEIGALQAEQNNENDRIAKEFLALKAEFPNINELKDVPLAVLQLAAEQGISLLDAHLRYNHAENKKINEAKQSAAVAEAASAGSAASVDADASSPEIEAMKQGVWR